jgi:hypothetical protein
MTTERSFLTRALCLLAATSMLASGEVFAAARGTAVAIPTALANVSNPDSAYEPQSNVFLAVTGQVAIKGQWVSPTGALLGGSWVVASTTAYQQTPSTRCGENGVCIVVWHETTSSSATTPMARLVSYPGGAGGTGGFVSAKFAIGPAGSNWQYWAGIAYSAATHEFLVTWQGDYSSPSLNNIWVARVNLSGQVLASFAVTTGGAYERFPSVAYNPSSGEYIIAYEGLTGNVGYTAVQRFANGAKVGNPITLDTAAAEYLSAAEYDSETQSVLVAWNRGGAQIYGKAISSSGTAGSLLTLSSNYGSYDALDLAFNPISKSFLIVTHGSNEDMGIEVSSGYVPSPAFTLTAFGGNGNFNPRLSTSTISPLWFAVTSTSHTTLHGQFATSTVDAGAGGDVPPPPPLSVAIQPNVSLPASNNTPITFTATAAGGTAPLTYKFYTYTPSGGWVVGQDYSTNNTFVYTPPAGTQNAVQVWVRNAGSVTQYDAWASTGYFTVSPPPAGGAPKITSLSANVTFPQAEGTPVTFTATATGGVGPLQYQFWIYNATPGWTLGRDYSTSGSFTYSPTAGQNAVQVWVRSANSVAKYDVWASSGYFTITAPAPTPVVKSLTGNVPLPAKAGTAMTFTAIATGGIGPLQFEFWFYNASVGWTLGQGYTTNNTFTYTPLSGQDVVQVWVRNAGSVAKYDTWATTGYFTINP